MNSTATRTSHVVSALLVCGSLILSCVAFILAIQEPPKLPPRVDRPALVEFDALRDFGRVPRAAILRGAVAFRNVANQKVSLAVYRSSCTCTVGHFEKSSLLPGDSTELEFEVNTSGAKAAGTSTFLVRALSGDRQQECFSTVKFRVDKRIGIFPDVLRFDETRIGAPVQRKAVAVKVPLSWKTANVTVENNDVPDYITATTSDELETEDGRLVTHLHLAMHPSAMENALGPVANALRVHVVGEHPTEQFVLGLRVETSAHTAIRAFPEVVYWDLGQKRQHDETVTLDAGGAAVKVDQVQCLPPKLLSKVTGNETATVTIQLTPTLELLQSLTHIQRATLLIEAHSSKAQRRLKSRIEVPIVMTP